MVGVLKSGPVERVPRRHHGVVVSGQFLSSNAIGSEMLQKNAFRGFMDPRAHIQLVRRARSCRVGALWINAFRHCDE